MAEPMPLRVVVAGGGVAALETVIALRDLAGDRVDVTLVAPREDFEYRPHAVVQPFADYDVQRVALSRVAADFHARLVPQPLTKVWPGSRRVQLGDGAELEYDRLVIALGARREHVFEHAIPFGGPEDVEPVRSVIDELGEVGRIAFVVPGGTSWSLPLYELALMVAKRAHELNADVELTIVTPEERPLIVFGPTASDEVQELLDRAGIRTICSATPEVPAAGRVAARPSHEEFDVDRVVALPRLKGIEIRSLPHDAEGFLPVDAHGRVRGLEGVYAAGDGTDFPVKQGGIACQQADAVAEAIAKAAGAPIEPRSFRPVLRAHLITGEDPRFMRTDLSGREGGGAESGTRPLWWPPSKIAGRYLAPYLRDAVRAQV